MKASILIALFAALAVGSFVVIYLATEIPHHTLEIHGMNDTYNTGEQYSFYYTISGFGKTCGTWITSYPDPTGKHTKAGEAIDCTRGQNSQISYDSRKDNRVFSSQIPEIPGIYNVTVNVEGMEPAVYFFKVVPSEEQKSLDTQSDITEYWKEQAKNNSNVETVEPVKASEDKLDTEDWWLKKQIEFVGLEKTYQKDKPIEFGVTVYGDGSGCASAHIKVYSNKTKMIAFEKEFISVCKYLGNHLMMIPLQVKFNSTDLESGKYLVDASYYQHRGSHGDIREEFEIVSSCTSIEQCKLEKRSIESSAADNIASSKEKSGFQVMITGAQQVRGGTTHEINVIVTRDSNPVNNAQIRITIEDYGEDILKEFKGRTDSNGRFVFSWEVPKFDDIKTLLAFIDATDDISVKTILFKFSVYCLPGESGCNIDGN